MEDNVVLALTMATIGQAGLCATILLARSSGKQVYLPLAIFFIVNGVVAAEPVFAAFEPALQTHLISILLPAYLLLGPMLWFYVAGLTSETVWKIKPAHGWHLIPFGLGIIATILIMSLPLEIREAIFIGNAGGDVMVDKN